MTDETEELLELNLSRQSKLVPYDAVRVTTLKVYGVGSVGSHFVRTAAKTGFKQISVYDMDVVEEENIAAQAFDFKHIGMPKVEAIKQIVLDGAGVEIEANDGRISEETVITPEPNTFYCCFFDSFEARKMLFEKLQGMPVIFIDARIGGYNMRHYLVDCNDKVECEQYLSTLTTGATSELVCGEKASALINATLSGLLVMNIINYLRGARYKKVFIGNIADDSMDTKIWKDGRGVKNAEVPELPSSD